MQTEPLRIIQISDTHLFADREKTLLGVNTLESFQAVINLVKADQIKPDFILHTGDLTQDGSESAYNRIADQLSEFQVPVYTVAGNHDDSQVMAKTYPRGMFSNQKQLVFDKWQLILLDSHVAGKVHGHLDRAELTFLEQALKTHPKQQTIIVFHHQPVPVECEWLDKIGLDNANELWELLMRFPHVHSILFGHIHQLYEGQKNFIKYYSTPSTCIQFKTRSDKFALEELAPAYRLLELYPNGVLRTSVHRTAHYVGKFEPHATGY
jgi:3',5'-cyclic-AMP phosphodiesterase